MDVDQSPAVATTISTADAKIETSKVDATTTLTTAPTIETPEDLESLSTAELLQILEKEEEELQCASVELEQELLDSLSSFEHSLIMKLARANTKIEVIQTQKEAQQNYNEQVRSGKFNVEYDALHVRSVYTALRGVITQAHKERELALGDLAAREFRDPSDSGSGSTQENTSQNILTQLSLALTLNQELGSQLQSDNTVQMETELSQQKQINTQLVTEREELNQFREALDEQLEAMQSMLMPDPTQH